MPILKNIGYLATCLDKGGQGDLHPIEKAALIWRNDMIKWVGREGDIPDEYSGEETFDANGAMVIPGLIDCHTHLAFGGWRSDEFEMRVKGTSYLEIAKAGGGILSTVKATREATEGELYKKASSILPRMAELGVTTVECKSGYGLSVEDELKTLRVYRRLGEDQPLRLIPTFLGAHTFPPEYKERRDNYVQLVIDKMIPAIAEEGLAEFCDVFVEESAFTPEEARRILLEGRVHGMEPKLHADQLTDTGGAALAAELEATSADHLEQISDRGIEAMAEADVIGVNLPLASLYTQQTPLNCRKLVEGGVKVAVATDFNPGSAPSYDLPLAMMLTCNQGRLTPSEVLKGATLYAAEAVGKKHRIGSLEEGKLADFAVIDAPSPNFWMYHYRPNCCRATVVNGQCISGKLTSLS